MLPESRRVEEADLEQIDLRDYLPDALWQSLYFGHPIAIRAAIRALSQAAEIREALKEEAEKVDEGTRVQISQFNKDNDLGFMRLFALP